MLPQSPPDAGGTGGTGGQTGGAGGSGQSQSGDAGPSRDAGETDPGSLVAALRSALVHRYSFNGSGTVVTDSVGTAHGTLISATLNDQGLAVLPGTGAFVDLPNGLLSASNDCTIESWLSWNGGAAWQRIFDFGSNDLGEGQRGKGRTYLFLTPQSGENVMAAVYSIAGFVGETILPSTSPLPIGEVSHVAVVIDSQSNRFSLYLNGALDASVALTQRLSEIQDVNVWLGASQFSTDPSLNGDMREFRFYERALSAPEIEKSFALGPDAPELGPQGTN